MDVATLRVAPQWTERLYPPSGGMDHLGLGQVILTRILPGLSPNVVVVTPHPRYWSFYTWLLWEFWQTDRQRTQRALAAFLKPREAILAIGAAGNLCEQPEHHSLSGGIIGSNAAGPHASSTDVYDAGLSYLKHRAGGYGAQYAGTISNTGLTLLAAPEAGVPCDVPTDLGQQIAKAFRGHVADTAYVRDYLADDSAQVPAEVVREYINRACLCQLRRDTAPDRALLRHAFLHGGEPSRATRQRATFRFLLDLAEQTDGVGLDEEDFRQLIYFRRAQNDAAFDSQPVNDTTARGWRMYQAREYYNFALNRMWQWLVAHGLEVSKDGLRSVPVSDLLGSATASLSLSSLCTRFGLPDPGLGAGHSVKDWQDWISTSAGVIDTDLDGAWEIAAPCHEHHLYLEMLGLDQDHPQSLVAAFLTLALVASRFGNRETEMRHRDDWQPMRDGGVERLSVQLFFDRWRAFLRAGTPAGEVLRWLLDHYVIRQHLRVANSKLPQNDTFRFSREGQRLRFSGLGAHITMNNPRFNSMTTVLYELGLMGQISTSSHAPTADGYRLLNEGDLPTPPEAASDPS